MFQKILVAFDGSKQAERAVAQATALSSKLGARLTVLYVVGHVAVPTRTGMTFIVDEELEAVGELELRKAEYLLKKARVRGETLIARGEPAQEILRLAERGEFDLVVLGVRKLGGIARLIRGSVSGTVMHGTHSSVLVVK